MSIAFNKIEIPISSDRVTYWSQRFPNDSDMFDGDALVLALSPSGYRPIWQETNAVAQGIKSKTLDLSSHRLEGFVLDLSKNQNCALAYYVLKELEDSLRNLALADDDLEYPGVVIHDYCLPDYADISAEREYTARKVSLEVEATQGTGGIEGDRVSWATRVICSLVS